MLTSAATFALVSGAVRSRGFKWDWSVFGVLAAFVYLYAVVTTCVILPWLSISVPGMTNLGILTATTLLALWCFGCCALFDAGSVPDGWQPDAEGTPAALQEVKKKCGGARYCNKCKVHKPPRTHHCRVCNRCIKRMDHHCVWTGNCIGHANYRAFLLLLIYGTAALWHAAGLLVAHGWHVLHAVSADRALRAGPAGRVAAKGSGTFWAHVALEGVAACLALPAAIAMTSLLSFHIKMVATNRTTIEWREGVTAQVTAGAGARPRDTHPYDIGLCNNLRELLGPNPDTWLWPPLRPTQGGTTFPTVFDPDVELPSYKL